MYGVGRVVGVGRSWMWGLNFGEDRVEGMVEIYVRVRVWYGFVGFGGF